MGGSLNHVYRTVWNQALGAMVAVAEISTARGKSPGQSGASGHPPRLPRRLRGALSALAVALAWGAVPTWVQANPTGGVAIQGQATFTTNGNNLLVTTQNGAGLNHSALNWQSFSIPTGSSTYFQQPTAASTSINRVVSSTPSLIFGNLGSNGNLVLVNQSGITVGAGAVVDTAGFTASALRMGDADALAGRLRFGDANAATAGVSILGSVLARSGDVVLLGSRVDTGSSALVQAPNGSTVLAAGQQIEITGRGLEGIVMQVQAPSDSAVNLGTLKGDAVGIFAGTLRHSGAIQANSAANEGGKIVLKALQRADVAGSLTASGLDGGTVNLSVAPSSDANALGVLVQSGAIEATGSSGVGGQVQISANNILSSAAIRVDGVSQGGSVAVLASDRALSTAAAQYTANSSTGRGGDILVNADVSNYTSGSYTAVGVVGGRVTLAGAEVKLPGTQVDASGAQGGGTVHVGGLMHGAPGLAAQGLALSNASTVLTNAGASFKADAQQSGNGGEVVLWSDQKLSFAGSISAKGGSASGNGGNAEVSGLTALGYSGTTDLSAA
ncbi:MAG: filamentous hemagglutinin N-terminal domain-containing protein, partial [Rhodoferax sp.]|nr:filamentous hemagglutinin N-terminal domain-containing protein [Rhodoferax sp.]